MTTLPRTEIQSLAPTAVLEMFVLDATVCGGGVYYFHAGTNQLGTSLVWQGNTYAPFPIQSDGFEWTSKGTLPRPRLRVSALDGLVGGLVRDLEDLIGATVTLKRCFAKHLDAVNFPGGVNPNADPTACWPDEPFKVERKTLENADVIEFELITPMDSQNAQIPKRRITANVCGWAYKGVECGYSGPRATCEKRLTSPTGDGGCVEHFGVTTGLISLSATVTANTYTRTTGSFITDGFQVGRLVSASGFTNAANNGLKTITAVAALTLTVSNSLLSEVASTGRMIKDSGDVPFGAFPGTARIR